MRIGGVGLLLGLHWVFFYGSIKASNVSIGVVCFSLVGFFTAFLEPLINCHRVSFKEVVFSLLTLFGVVLIFHFDTRYRLGIGLGIISSALAALFTITNKKIGNNYSTSTMLLYEIGRWLCRAFLYFTVLFAIFSCIDDCSRAIRFYLFIAFSFCLYDWFVFTSDTSPEKDLCVHDKLEL